VAGRGLRGRSACHASVIACQLSSKEEWDGENWEETEDWQEHWEEEDWEDAEWEDDWQGQSSSSRTQHFSSRPSPAQAPKPAVPRAAQAQSPRPAKKLQARLPEELGFSVGSGVRNKGWEIGQMEDGVRPADDGEPDVFFSHSYSDNCRRVDMGLFECNCPNSLSCCSHLYAACVALPQYRHRAAFLWALRQDLGAAAGSEENPSTRSWSSRAPRGGFEGCRRRVKAALLRHLPLEDVADAAVDAAVGMWVRVEWLRQGRVPKLGAYWADAVERSLGDAAASTDIDLGTAAQDRIRNLLGKLRMKPAELAPLLLALAQGHLPESERLSQRWEGLCRHFWAQVAAAEAADGKEGPGKSSSRTLAEVRLAAVAAALEVTPASTSCAAERLWCIEETLIRRYGVRGPGWNHLD